MPPLNLTLPLDKPLRGVSIDSPGSQTSLQPTSSQASGQTAWRALFNEACDGLNNATNVKHTFIHVDVKDPDSPERLDQTCPARLSCHEAYFPESYFPGVDDRLCSDDTRVAESGVPSYVHTMACQLSQLRIGASSLRDRAATEVLYNIDKLNVKNTFIDGSPANTTPAAARGGVTCNARLQGTQLANFGDMSPVSSNDAVFQSSWPASPFSLPSPLSQPTPDQSPYVRDGNPAPAPAQQADTSRPVLIESINSGSNTAGHGYGEGSGPQIYAKVSFPAPGLALVPPISGGSAEHGFVGSDGLPSCRPCAWLFKDGCRNGNACIYCHRCPEGEIKRRKKLKVEGMRAADRQEKALNDSIAATSAANAARLAASGPASASIGGQPHSQHHAVRRPQGYRR